MWHTKIAKETHVFNQNNIIAEMNTALLLNLQEQFYNYKNTNMMC